MARLMMTKILMCIVVTTMLAELALAVDHPVGVTNGNGGWDTSTDLGSWASSQTFTVGDNLVFTYLPNHDVVEVSKANYDNCSPSGTPNSGSPTTIALTAAGTRYFICGTTGHCGQGMKVEIKTVAAGSTPSPTTTTPTSPTTPSSSSPDTPSPPASTTPKTPAPVKPSSAETVKVTVVSMVGLGFLMMI